MIRIGFYLFIAIGIFRFDSACCSAFTPDVWLRGFGIIDAEADNQDFEAESGGRIVSEDSIKFVYPMSTTVVKRKSPITIRWSGGQPEITYFLELYKNGIFQQQIAEVKDVNRYEWQVTKDLNGGKDYQFRLVNSRFFGDYSFSDKFQIKNRIPRAFWVVPAAAGAAGIYFLIKLIVESGPEPEEQDLPAPIEPY